MTPNDPHTHCDELRERLPLLIYPDELVGEELAEVEEHLVVCSDCAELHAQLVEVAARLDLLEDPALSPAQRRALLAGVQAATSAPSKSLDGEPSLDPNAEPAELLAALDLVEAPALTPAQRERLRAGVLARVGLEASAAEGEDLREEDLVAGAELSAALNLLPTPALDGAQRAAFRDGVLARVGGSPDAEDFSDVEAALDLVEAPALSSAQRAAFAEGVLARIGGEVEDFADVEAGLDLVEAPTLSPAQRAAFAEGVLARAEHRVEDFADVEAGLDLVEAPTLSPAQRAAFAEGVLARAEHRVEDFADVEAGLDLVEAPTLSPAQRAAFAEGVLARAAGEVEDFAEVERALDLVELPAQPAAITPPGEERRPAGQLITLSFRATLIRAAAAILLAGMIGLAGYHSLPKQPGPPTADLASLEREVEEAEKVARNLDPNTSNEPMVLAEARASYEKVVSRAQANPQAGRVAREARHQLAAFKLVQPPRIPRLRPRPKASPTKATTAPGTYEDPSSSFLISNEPVLREYPDSLAALYVLKRYRNMLTQIAKHGHIRFDQTTADPKMVAFREQITHGFRKQDRLKLVERDLQALTTLRFDWSQVRQKVPAAKVTKAAHQAELLQRGLHAEELGDLIVARRCYRDVIALGDSKAAAIARDHLNRLG